ncbi:Helicase C 2 and DEAD 2 domain containing protein [Trichuris trichiura]|uniref:Helicase C 2 and DEAD 2 domain containing protein n=1 Tax=Trichuris trichiura TaxID=36087 RepID=A0A077Z993_TRITR|nr:Helicase C 2 and DEAD 2 domain containing protein [Trichuris trichiura]
MCNEICRRFCPFFKAREKQEEADLILMPYNYLLDPTSALNSVFQTRRLNKVPLRGNILIFDEAHNLVKCDDVIEICEKICEEAASFSFKITDIAAALKEARGALKMLLDEQESLRQTIVTWFFTYGVVVKEDSEVPFGSSSSMTRGSQSDVNLNELSHLILLMEGLEERLNEEVLPKLLDSPESCPTAFPGQFLQDILARAQLHPNLCEGISLLADQVSSYLTTKAESSVWMSRGLALQKFSRLLNVIYGDSLATGRCSGFVSATDFKVYLCSEKSGMDAAAKDKSRSFMVNYWCFSAGYSMSALLSHGVHSVIVTSGTLSPLNSFTNEMRIPFSVCMEGEHVVGGSHFEVYVCPNGPDGTSLNGSYANRSNKKYLASLGNSVVNLCRIVPQGLLVFFPSYGQLDFCTEHWKASIVRHSNSGIMKRIEKLKNVFVEPRRKDQFADVLNAYKKLTEEGMQPVGAVFFCVMRGKVSEGFDFADCAARAVVIIGIPFPPAFDPRVRLKKDHLNSLTRSKQSVSFLTERAFIAFLIRFIIRASVEIIPLRLAWLVEGATLQLIKTGLTTKRSLRKVRVLVTVGTLMTIDCLICSEIGSSQSVDGETWYVLEAVRAVNQAIGRVIRHKDDFGAVILADCSIVGSLIGLWIAFPVGFDLLYPLSGTLEKLSGLYQLSLSVICKQFDLQRKEKL